MWEVPARADSVAKTLCLFACFWVPFSSLGLKQSSSELSMHQRKLVVVTADGERAVYRTVVQ